LATLDLRQESAAHDAALAGVLGDAQWPLRDAAQRTSTLAALLEEKELSVADATDAARVLDVFRAVAEARRHYGERALGPYIVSMSHSAADVLAVLVLARAAHCVDAQGDVPLDVAPLFETIDDLRAAPEILAQLLALPAYRRHLAARGGRQIVML